MRFPAHNTNSAVEVVKFAIGQHVTDLAKAQEIEVAWKEIETLLNDLYRLRNRDPAEMAMDGIPGHFLSDRRMVSIAHTLGHVDYKEMPGW